MKDERLYLEHIVEASQKLFGYLPANVEELANNEMIVDAVIKKLSNITESADNIQKVTKSEYPEIPWNQIKGMRNILVHDYLGDLDYRELWKVVHNDLPNLVTVAKKILKEKYEKNN